MKRTLIVTMLLIGLFSLLNAFPCQHGQKEHCQEGHHFTNEKPHHPKMMQRHRKEMFFEIMKEELDLTKDQQAVMEESRLEFEKFLVQKHAEIRILQLEKEKANKEKDFNKIKRLTDNIFDLKKIIAEKRIKLREKHWNLLTTTQKEKFDELKLKRHRKQINSHQKRQEKF